MISKRVFFALVCCAFTVPGLAEEPAVGATPPGVNLPAYRLQPGDVMTVQVWKETELQAEVLVRPDGGFSFPLAGGATPFASINDIVILRRQNGQQKAIHFHYSDVARGRDLTQNVLLQGGDTVVVP